MAVHVCSEISSPRISFSHDLDFIPVEPHRLDSELLNPAIDFDFDFCTNRTSSEQISSADELFSDGKILPVQIRKICPKSNQNDEFRDASTKKKRLIEFLSTGNEEEEEEKPIRTFWNFGRSSSVNSDRKAIGNGLIGRSLQFMTRSNSTGSVPNPKPSAKIMQKQHSLKESSINRRSSSVSGSYQYYPYNQNNSNSKRPFLKSNSRSYGNGVRITTVLNIPPTYIAKGTVSLFGIGSFFCSKKSKKKRK